MKVIVELDLADDVEPESLKEAIKDSLSTLKLDDGDTLYLNSDAISVKLDY